MLNCRHPLEDLVENAVAGIQSSDVVFALSRAIHNEALKDEDYDALRRALEVTDRLTRTDLTFAFRGSSDRSPSFTSVMTLSESAEALGVSIVDIAEVLRGCVDGPAPSKEDLEKTRGVFIDIGQRLLAKTIERNRGCF